MGAHRTVRQAPVLVFIEPPLFSIGQCQQILLAGTNLKNLLDSVDKDLALQRSKQERNAAAIYMFPTAVSKRA